MAENDPRTPDRGPVPDPHANEPAPAPDVHTRPGPDADAVRPDQDEDLGPVPELFGAAGTEAATVVSDDPDLETAALEQGAEAEGVESAQILGLLIAVIAVLVAIVLGIIYLARFAGEGQAAARQTDLRYPDLQELRARDADLLSNYAVGEEGYRVPLTRAQELVVRDYGASGGTFEAPGSRASFNLAFPRSGSSGYQIAGPVLGQQGVGMEAGQAATTAAPERAAEGTPTDEAPAEAPPSAPPEAASGSEDPEPTPP